MRVGGSALMHTRNHPPADSPLGAACVLHALGVTVPPVTIRDPDGVVLGTWQPGQDTVLGEPVDPARAGNHTDVWEPSGKILASLSPVRGGRWRGEVLELPGGAVVHPGWLETADGELAAWMDGPLPPHAAAALVRALSL